MNISIASDHAGFEQKQALVDVPGRAGPRRDRPRPGQRRPRGLPGLRRARSARRGGRARPSAACSCAARASAWPWPRTRCDGIRAANVVTPQFAELSREHNDANVVTLSGRFVDEETNRAIVDAFLATPVRGAAATPAAWRRSWPSKPSEAEPTARACSTGAGRCASISRIISDAAFRATRARIPKGAAMPLTYLPEQDPAVADALRQELARQRDSVELIASENFTSPAVMEAVGSRAHEQVRRGLSRQALLRRLRVRRRRGETSPASAPASSSARSYANVQPHCGAQANLARVLGAASSPATRCWA